MKYNLIYLFIPFFWNSPTGQTRRRRIFAHDGSNDTDSCKDVPFLDFVDIAPQLGGKIPQNPNFGGVNRRFQAKRVKSKNMLSVKKLKLEKSKMAGPAILKNRTIAISRPRFDWSRRNLAQWRIRLFMSRSAVKFFLQI